MRAAVCGVAAALVLAAPAQAQPADPVDDGWWATCTTLDKLMGRWVDPNVETLLGVTTGIAESYGLTQQAAADVLVVQVHEYCAHWWPAVQYLAPLYRNRLP